SSTIAPATAPSRASSSPSSPTASRTPSRCCRKCERAAPKQAGRHVQDLVELTTRRTAGVPAAMSKPQAAVVQGWSICRKVHDSTSARSLERRCDPPVELRGGLNDAVLHPPGGASPVEEGGRV